jgi:hypothetical protein
LKSGDRTGAAPPSASRRGITAHGLPQTLSSGFLVRTTMIPSLLQWIERFKK